MGDIPGAPIHLDLTLTMGTTFIGTLISAIFMGITTMQTIFYYSTYPDDIITLKVIVAVIWILDALSLAFFGHSLYTYLIANYANPLALLASPWSLIWEHLPSACVALLVHFFLIHRAYSLNNKLAPLAIFLLMVSLLAFSMAIVSIVIGMKHINDFKASEVKWVFIVPEVTTAFVDIAVAAAICLQLRKTDTGFRKTTKMINVLSAYTIGSGALTSLITITTMILYFVSPDSMLLFVIYPVSAKAYANALLASLNCRQVARDSGIDSTIDFADQQWRSSALARHGTSGIRNTGQGDPEKAQISLRHYSKPGGTQTATSASTDNDDLRFARVGQTSYSDGE